MRIYLDNCCFNRPFDDQGQTRIRIEAEAKLCLQRCIREGKLELVWSYILDFENSANPYEDRKQVIAAWQDLSGQDISESDAVLATAVQLEAVGFKSKDALHIACAVSADCTYFVTTDDNILKHNDDVKEITICDPTRVVRELEL